MRSMRCCLSLALGAFVLGCGFGRGSAEGARVVVVAQYAGAESLEVEAGVVIPLEQEAQQLVGVDRVRSTAVSGCASVSITFRPGIEEGHARDAVAGALRSVVLPEGVQGVSLLPVHNPKHFAVVAPVDADQVLEDLRRAPGVGSAGLIGKRRARIVVEVDPQRLQALDLALHDALLAELPGEALFRPLPTTIEEVTSRVLRPGILLGDVAQVRLERTAEIGVSSSGEPRVLVWAGAETVAWPEAATALHLDRSVELVSAPGTDIRAVVAGLGSGLPQPFVAEVHATHARFWYYDEPPDLLDSVLDSALPPSVWVRAGGEHVAEIVVTGPPGAPLPPGLLSEVRAALAAGGATHMNRSNPGKAKLGIRLDRARAAQVGVMEAEVDTAVRMATGVDRGDVVFRWSGVSAETLEGVMVPTADGSLIPLQAVARIEHGLESPPIQRVDGHRAHVVSAEIPAGFDLGSVSLPEGWVLELQRGRMPMPCSP